jgi:hypothetical protein
MVCHHRQPWLTRKVRLLTGQIAAQFAEGFDADWQLLIEIKQEQEADVQQQAASPR